MMAIINLLAALIFVVLSIMTLFITYFFWKSKDGELRIILIRKHIGLSIMFMIFAIVSSNVTEVSKIISPTICVFIATPLYGWQTYKLLRYLILNN